MMIAKDAKGRIDRLGLEARTGTGATIIRTGTGACPYDVALSFIMLPKWYCRDNPLWLSCIRTGTGACPYG